ncbi:hypothetical protein PG999_010773 [Apiospora kogelbergensis]|uniref:Uncharacterized protein n=1 Tax=Apiospora kogelbergensis TaxID=1337665 RepID=A0AAW0QM98_9PEZI
MKTFDIIIAATLAMSAAATPALVPKETPCTTGSPLTTAGYPINGYSHATPTQFAGQAYKPDSEWAGSHVLGTYTYDVPLPLETGFAYAQFKCQFKCNSFGGSSFFVKYAGANNNEGSLCTCYDDLMNPDTFVADKQAMVGAWNSICK